MDFARKLYFISLKKCRRFFCMASLKEKEKLVEKGQHK